MTESETEAETLARLEAALLKIAGAVHKPKPVAAGEIDRVALIDTLDLMISRLRGGLTRHNITE
jgi:hypothetical protein